MNRIAVVVISVMVAYFSSVVYGVEMRAEPDARNSISLTIQEGIARILKDSRLLKIETAGMDMSFEDTLVALSPLLPHINAAMARTQNRHDAAMMFGGMEVPTSDRNYWSGGFEVYQTLFDFGKSISNYKASTEMLSARKASVESVKRMVTLEFIVSYLDLLETEKMITVAENEAASLASYLTDMEHLYSQGVIVENDLLPAKVRLADAKQKVIASRNRREVVAALLNTMLTVPLTKNILVQDIRTDTPPLPVLEDAWRSAETKRPEITFFNNQIQSSALRERAKAVENFPTVFLNGGCSYAENQYMLYDGNAHIMFGVKMDLFDGGASWAQTRKERYLGTQLQEQKDKLVDDIKYEVKRGYLGVKDAEEKIAVAKEALAQAEENVRFYRTKYNNGAATSTDVLEAINLQTKAQTNYYSADYELKRSYARLLHAMGVDMASSYKEMER